MAEAIGLAVFTCGVVGVRQARHEDNAGLLAQTLNSHSNT